ncbi:MAG: hypothetical protein EGQ81_07850 [Akkermansia sp.]|nr:hypothetical protein [Akkermansia sp.]
MPFFERFLSSCFISFSSPFFFISLQVKKRGMKKEVLFISLENETEPFCFSMDGKDFFCYL